jgi:hypothetical protein
MIVIVIVLKSRHSRHDCDCYCTKVSSKLALQIHSIHVKLREGRLITKL